MTDTNQKMKTKKQWLFENVTSITLALFLVLGIRSSVIEAFKIPSGSMIPTLLIGDHIFVNKFAYGLTIPFTEWIMDEPLYLMKRDGPKQGDIIVFRYPRDPSIYYIKRVIGTPSDTIELKAKQVYVNGTPISQDLIVGEAFEEIISTVDHPKYQKEDLSVYKEKLDNESPTIMWDKSSYSFENFSPVTVPEGHYFVMGDNRDHSNDSRFWGFVPIENIKGKAVVIWLSLWIDWNADLYFFRPSRIGSILH